MPASSQASLLQLHNGIGYVPALYSRRSLRSIHTAYRKPTVPASPTPNHILTESYITDASPLPEVPAMPLAPAKTPLSVLPLGMLLRNLTTSAVTSSPILMPPSVALLSFLANSKSPLLNPDRNPALRFALKKTLYAQFCGGENSAEVARTSAKLKELGFTGVILGYGKEIVMKDDEMENKSAESAEARSLKEIEDWKQGNIETVRAAQAGDYVALKFTGAGRQVFFDLVNRSPLPETLAKAMDEICTLAVSRRVQLLIDAEQTAIQDGIDDWALTLMRKYNTTPGRPTVFCTYQAYLKKTPGTIKAHLDIAQKEGWVPAVKLVRGAYLASDPRHLIHDTKADTDKAYNGLASSLLTRQWSDILPGSGPFPPLSLIVATHNAESVTHARRIVESGQAKTPVAFAQLQGMADEVSCSLVEPQSAGIEGGVAQSATPGLGAYKYLVWGSTAECMKYLVRRAEENKVAVQRTKDSRNAMWAELMRRCRGAVGLGK